jgi:2-oxoglutarate ferredoxin oxidoreductase subunit beta
MFNPKLKVVVISGDGDLTSIGGNHLIHAARRNTDLTVICANNNIYGMTGGQVASTTPLGSITTTTTEGNPFPPFDLCKLVLGAGAPHVARFSVAQPLSLVTTIKKYLTTNGFSFIDVLSPCHIQFGRRNSYDTPANMLKTLMERCISKEEAEHLSEVELRERILTGEFSDE